MNINNRKKNDNINSISSYRLIITLSVVSLLFIILLSFGVSAEVNATSCCEKTTSGFYCQNAPQNECNANFRNVPSACESTSYCRLGTCYDSNKGTCTGNTPEIVCNKERNGTWFETPPAQCSLGCCVLGDQAAFVSLVRCKKLSASFGLQTNFDKTITNEVSCVLSVQSQDKGACVFESEFEKTCKFTTRADCSNTVNENGTSGEFFKGKLCTAPELGTICGKTTETLCAPGKDEVYFKDTCGNPANIYDSSKINDADYWANIRTKLESCNPDKDNGNSKSCGNCNYLLGSFCRNSKDAGSSATYGNNICANLNCKNTQNGNSYRHGESWCVQNDAGTTNQGDNSVGSRFYKHICINGEEVLEQCADFRQEECIEDTIKTNAGDFSQAACRVNRWQDCLVQTSKSDCENTDKRDCLWKEGISLNSTKASKDDGVCIPKNTPGLQFWASTTSSAVGSAGTSTSAISGTDAQAVCGQANTKCVVTYESGLFSGEKCVGNCECLTDTWAKERNQVCVALGDCGPKINWLGQQGYKLGFNITVGKVKTGEKK